MFGLSWNWSWTELKRIELEQYQITTEEAEKRRQHELTLAQITYEQRKQEIASEEKKQDHERQITEHKIKEEQLQLETERQQQVSKLYNEHLQTFKEAQHAAERHCDEILRRPHGTAKKFHVLAIFEYETTTAPDTGDLVLQCERLYENARRLHPENQLSLDKMFEIEDKSQSNTNDKTP